MFIHAIRTDIITPSRHFTIIMRTTERAICVLHCRTGQMRTVNALNENLKPFEFLALVIKSTLIVSFRLFPFSHTDVILKQRRRKYFEN